MLIINFLLINCKENVHSYQLWQVLPSNSVTICLDQLYFFLAVLAAPQHYESEKIQFPEQMTSIPIGRHTTAKAPSSIPEPQDFRKP